MKKFYLLLAVLIIISSLGACEKEIVVETVVENDITTQVMKDNSIVQLGNMSRLIKAFNKAADEKEITIAFIGGSITYGAGGSKEDTYVKIVENWFKSNFPDTKVTAINAGLSGTDSVLGIHRLKEDVLKYNPDIVIVEFAVNDGVGDDLELKNIEQSYAYENIIRDILNTDQEAAVLPVFCCVEGGYNSQKDKITTGLYYDIPMVSYLDAVMPEINAKTLEWSEITKDGIHPNKVGHRLLGALVTNILEIAKEKMNDPISINELPNPLTKASYTNADVVNSSSEYVKELGSFDIKTNNWIFKKGWNANDTKDALVLEIECKSLQILVNKTTKNDGAFFDVIIDDDMKYRVSTKSSSSYEMLTSDLIFKNEKSEIHKIEIILSSEMPEGCDGKNDEILSLLISK